MTQIDKYSIVHEKAKIGAHCVIGPYCTIGPNVRIGDHTVIRSHAVIEGHTTIGQNCEVFPFVTIGIQSQDQKYVPSTVTYTEIGDRNTIREFVSIHSGTEAYSKTTVGDDCVLLAQSHIAHNCKVGNDVTLSHAATLGGHVVVDDYANIGGLAAVHQFCRVGKAAMVAGMARVVQDVLPFTIAEGHPAQMRIINRIGMKRAQYLSSEIAEVRRALQILFDQELRLEESLKQIKHAFPSSNNIALMIEAINSSQKGLAYPERSRFPSDSSESSQSLPPQT